MWGYDQHLPPACSGEIAADPPASASAGAEWNDNESPIPVSSKDPMWGKRDAPVTVVIFSDYQCPFCSRVEPTLAQVPRDDVRGRQGPPHLEECNPLPYAPERQAGRRGRTQGVFAMAGSDAFWKFHDTAFKNQGALNGDSYSEVGPGRRAAEGRGQGTRQGWTATSGPTRSKRT